MKRPWVLQEREERGEDTQGRKAVNSFCTVETAQNTSSLKPLIAPETDFSDHFLLFQKVNHL